MTELGSSLDSGQGQKLGLVGGAWGRGPERHSRSPWVRVELFAAAGTGPFWLIPAAPLTGWSLDHPGGHDAEYHPECACAKVKRTLGPGGQC